MRRLMWSMLGWLIAGSMTLAQAPANVPPSAADPRLESVLANWEKAMTGVQSLHATCVRTKLDKTYQTTEVFAGYARYLRGGPGQTSRAALELFKKNQPQVFEKYLCSGNFLYEWSPANKVIRVHQLPPAKPGQIADDNFLSFLFGMKAAEAKSRYQIEYKAAPNDKWYVYLEIMPRVAVDKADFTKARLTLLQANHLPRQLWFLQPNGDEVTWDFPEVQSPAKLSPADFAHPNLPQGWQFVQVPTQNQPRVMRNNDNP
jgi:TIGR03009 family protein